MSTPTDNQRPSAVFIGSLTVICAYMLVRGCIYQFYPVDTLQAWFYRDTWMTIPRLAAFGALLLLNRRWKWARFDLPLNDFSRAARLGFVPIALWLYFFSGGTGETFTSGVRCVGVLTSLAVGLFEEYAFRGPLLAALCARWPSWAAVLVSSILFTLYHFQAQPIRSWGQIFLSGVVFAHLRLRGLSLGCLALIHGVIDSLFFFFPTDVPGFSTRYSLVLQGGLLVCAVVTFPWSTAKAAAPVTDRGQAGKED